MIYVHLGQQEGLIERRGNTGIKQRLCS